MKEDVGIQTDDSLIIFLIGDVGEDCEDDYIGETFWRLPEGYYFNHCSALAHRSREEGFSRLLGIQIG